MTVQAIDLDNTVIIDTETTGLDDFAQIVELSAICGQTGNVLFSSLIRPNGWIPEEATAIHGITNADVKDAPRFNDIIQPLFNAIFSRSVIIYNTAFDSRLFIQSYGKCDQITCHTQRLLFGMLRAQLRSAQCAMHWYAEFYGQTDKNGLSKTLQRSYRWQSLSNACAQQNVDVSDLKAHRALADCEMTRRLINAVNSKLIEG